MNKEKPNHILNVLIGTLILCLGILIGEFYEDYLNSEYTVLYKLEKATAVDITCMKGAQILYKTNYNMDWLKVKSSKEDAESMLNKTVV